MDHTILLKRLRDIIGLQGNALKWCQSYLQNRPQHVRIGNSTSDPVVNDFSVPQGSVLGPLWFTVYTYPVHNIIMKHKLNYHVYADDTQLYFSFKPSQNFADESISRIETCVCEIRVWMQENFLKLNDHKTEFLILGSRKQLSKVTIPHINIGDSKVTAHTKFVILV